MFGYTRINDEYLFYRDNCLDMSYVDKCSYFTIHIEQLGDYLKKWGKNAIDEITYDDIKREKLLISIECREERIGLRAQGLLKELPPPGWRAEQWIMPSTHPRESIERFNSKHLDQPFQKQFQIPDEVIENTRELKAKSVGHYVYHLLDPTEEVFYVGYTTKPLARWAWHMTDALHWSESRVTCSAARLIKHKIEQQEWFFMSIRSSHFDEQEALQEERQEIRRLAAQICNIKDNPMVISQEQKWWNRFLSDNR